MLFDHTLMNHQKIFSMRTAKKTCVVKALKKKAMKYLTYVRYNMDNGNLFFWTHLYFHSVFPYNIAQNRTVSNTHFLSRKKQTANIFQLIIKTDIINVNYSIFLQEGTKSTQITTS